MTRSVFSTTHASFVTQIHIKLKTLSWNNLLSTIWTVKQYEMFIESYFKKILHKGFIFFHYVIFFFFFLESLQFFSKSINDLDLTCPVTYFLSVCEGPPLGPVADPDSWCTVPLSSPCCVLYSLEKAQQPAKLVVI